MVTATAIRSMMGRLEKRATPGQTRSLILHQYRRDPVGYANNVLRVSLTPDQAAVARSLLEPPFRSLVKSGHNIGKSFLMAWLLNWWYDSRDPSMGLSTAPTKRDVEDIVWTEVRLQRARAGLSNDFIGPSAPEMRSGPEHYSKGFTASTGESFQGRHRPHMFFGFDEAEGIDATYWNTANTMFQPDGTNAFLAILNPTTTTSQSYREERAFNLNNERKWKVFEISSLNHPNIAAELAGLPQPIPGAVSLAQVKDWLGDWFEPVPAEERNVETDIEFPPGSNCWYRPDNDGESRVLGRRPSAGSRGVWSEFLWKLATAGNAMAAFTPADIPQVGIDVARYGDDRTEMHSRRGPVSLNHEDHGGWNTVRTAERAMEIADELAAKATATRDKNSEPLKGKDIPLKIDDTGVGGGVTDIVAANGYKAVPVNSGERARDDQRYQRVRDQLWFDTVALCRAGKLSLKNIPAKTLQKLEAQALAPVKIPMPDRRWRVQSKEDTKKEIGRSPDGMDAVNLAYYEAGMSGGAEWVGQSEHRSWRDRSRSNR